MSNCCDGSNSVMSVEPHNNPPECTLQIIGVRVWFPDQDSFCYSYQSICGPYVSNNSCGWAVQWWQSYTPAGGGNSDGKSKCYTVVDSCGTSGINRQCVALNNDRLPGLYQAEVTIWSGDCDNQQVMLAQSSASMTIPL